MERGWVYCITLSKGNNRGPLQLSERGYFEGLG